jgi:hypothetical protein
VFTSSDYGSQPTHHLTCAFAPGAATTARTTTNARTYELVFLQDSKQGSVQPSISYSEIPNLSRINYTTSLPSSGFILEPIKPSQSPSQLRTMGYCDHDKCRNPYCIETQYRIRGFRDDLKHHEDDDKNGNMKDGDNVGTHSPG